MLSFKAKKCQKKCIIYVFIRLYSVVKVKKKYYPQIHLEEYKYEIKKC